MSRTIADNLLKQCSMTDLLGLLVVSKITDQTGAGSTGSLWSELKKRVGAARVGVDQAKAEWKDAAPAQAASAPESGTSGGGPLAAA